MTCQGVQCYFVVCTKEDEQTCPWLSCTLQCRLTAADSSLVIAWSLCSAKQSAPTSFSINLFDQHFWCCHAVLCCAVLLQAVRMAQPVCGTCAAGSASVPSRPPTGPLSVGCCFWIHPRAWQGTMQAAAAAAAASKRPNGCSRWLSWRSMQVKVSWHVCKLYTSHDSRALSQQGLALRLCVRSPQRQPEARDVAAPVALTGLENNFSTVLEAHFPLSIPNKRKAVIYGGGAPDQNPGTVYYSDCQGVF